MSWIELVTNRHPQQVPQGVTPPQNASDWYRIENNAENTEETDVYVYDAIGGWFGVYADEFVRDFRDIKSKQINLRLNSPGGSVFEGIAIANAIRSHPSNITVYVDGLAASIASVIALAGNRLVMMPNSQMMIHDASGGCYGNAADMEFMVGLLNKQSDNIADAYADRAGGTAAEWRDLMKAETWYTAKEAVAAGLADEVLETPAKDPVEDALAAKMQSVWNLTAYRYAGREAAPSPSNLPAFANVGETVPATTLPEKPEVVAVLGDRPATSTFPKEAKVEIILGGNPVDVTDDIVGMIRDAAKAKAKPDESPPATVDTALLEALRAVVREELDQFKAALPPWLKPDEEEEEEGEEEETEDASTEEVEDASDSEDAEDETAAEPVADSSAADAQPSADTVDTELGDPDNTAASTETTDEADFFALVAHLTESPSPSADDIFNRLKEAL